MDLEADRIEREILARLDDAVYVGMGNREYFAMIAKVLARYIAEKLAENHN